MKRILPLSLLSSTLVCLALATPGFAQGFGQPLGQLSQRRYPSQNQWAPNPNWNRVPDISGTWYMNGDPYQPCAIRQRGPDGRALFTNEKGDSTWGFVDGTQVWIPAWSDGAGSQGLEGRLRGNRIVWPNGSYWSR